MAGPYLLFVSLWRYWPDGNSTLRCELEISCKRKTILPRHQNREGKNISTILINEHIWHFSLSLLMHFKKSVHILKSLNIHLGLNNKWYIPHKGKMFYNWTAKIINKGLRHIRPIVWVSGLDAGDAKIREIFRWNLNQLVENTTFITQKDSVRLKQKCHCLESLDVILQNLYFNHTNVCNSKNNPQKIQAWIQFPPCSDKYFLS